MTSVPYLEFIFPGIPVPYVRMNHQNIWTERVQNYLAYKLALATSLRAKFPELVIEGPPTSDKKARAQFLKRHKSVSYRLDFRVFEPKEKGDWDNYGKGIGDALQDAGLIVNDKKIKTGSWVIGIDSADPRVEIVLFRYCKD